MPSGSRLASQHDRRLRCAAYWCTQTWLWWFAEQALQALPEDGLLSLVSDRTLKGKRGSKHPVAHKTRLSPDHPDVFGFRVVLLMAQWHVSRIPVDFALIRRTDEPNDQPEHAWFRQMLPEFRRPTWCQEAVVTAEAASASRAHLATSQARGYWDNHGAAADMEICPWQSRQRAGDASAAREGYPDAHASRQSPTPPDLLGLC